MTVPRDLLPLGFLSVEFLWAPEQQVKIFFVLVHTAELDSTVCIIWQSRTPWCASYGGVGFHGVHHTAESDSMVCIIQQSRTPWCASCGGVGFHDVHHMAELDSTLCIIQWSRTQRCASYGRVK